MVAPKKADGSADSVRRTSDFFTATWHLTPNTYFFPPFVFIHIPGVTFIFERQESGVRRRAPEVRSLEWQRALETLPSPDLERRTPDFRLFSRPLASEVRQLFFPSLCFHEYLRMHLHF
jgi:hypothetical protein